MGAAGGSGQQTGSLAGCVEFILRWLDLQRLQK
jgi:hypothetical protein